MRERKKRSKLWRPVKVRYLNPMRIKRVLKPKEEKK